MAWEIISCDTTGSARVAHPQAKPLEPATLTLNDAGEFSFQIPIGDQTYKNLNPVSGREVMVWLDQRLIWWGPVTLRRAVDRNHWEITCKGLEWYFTKRVMGKVGRNNYLINGDFGTGDLSGWQPIGVTANVVTQWGTHEGSYQANLYQSGSGQDTFLYQQVTVQPGYYTLAAWFQIRADSTYVGPGLDGRGLYVERLGANGQVDDVQFFAITDDTPRGTFQRATTNMQVDRADTILRIRLYSTRCTNATPSGGRPPGSIIWAKVQLVLQDSQSFPYPSDLADVFNNLCLHAQDSGYGKSDLAILASNGATGTIVDRTYFHSDHQVIFDAFKEWSDAGLCDFRVTWNQNTMQRFLTLFAPRMGSIITRYKLEIGGYLRQLPTVEEDGDKVITSAIVTGQGSGPDTDEGGAVDTSQTNGLVLESIATQRSGGYYDQLALQAGEIINVSKGAFPVPQATLSPELIGIVGLGDIISIYDPVANLYENVRITATSIDLEASQYSATLQPF